MNRQHILHALGILVLLFESNIARAAVTRASLDPPRGVGVCDERLRPLTGPEIERAVAGQSIQFADQNLGCVKSVGILSYWRLDLFADHRATFKGDRTPLFTGLYRIERDQLCIIGNTGNGIRNMANKVIVESWGGCHTFYRDAAGRIYMKGPMLGVAMPAAMNLTPIVN